MRTKNRPEHEAAAPLRRALGHDGVGREKFLEARTRLSNARATLSRARAYVILKDFAASDRMLIQLADQLAQVAKRDAAAISSFTRARESVQIALRRLIADADEEHDGK